MGSDVVGGVFIDMAVVDCGAAASLSTIEGPSMVLYVWGENLQASVAIQAYLSLKTIEGSISSRVDEVLLQLDDGGMRQRKLFGRQHRHPDPDQ